MNPFVNKNPLIYCFFSLAAFFVFFADFSQAAEQGTGAASYGNFATKISHDIKLEIGPAENILDRTTMESWGIEKTALAYNPDYRSEIENTNFCRNQKSIVCNLTFDVRKGYHIQKISKLELNEKPIVSYLSDLERQVNKDPVNAEFSMENGKIIISHPSSQGIRLDKEKSLSVILEHFKSGSNNFAVDLPYEKIDPEISDEAINTLGISSLIGEGRSNFKGSPKNRIFNINVATRRYDGVLIKPGEEFSFVKVLGPVDGEHGYLPELVIKNDKTEPEFGGGICQVSTTAFRAAIYSGLKITARRNHAYPVKYYNPQGLDATVYVPRPDLRFINNTPGYILIQTKIEGTELIFQFYGTNDGRKINVIGPTITERNPDGSMKATFTQEVFEKNGATLIEDVFKSAYASPSKYPHPGEILTQKPADWSDKQWQKYKKDNNL